MDATINKERDELFNALCRKKGNRLCFDCNTPNPKWTSKNYCVFVCLDCSGIHRSLGVHISRVKSANMDRWSRDELDVFKASGGNDAARAFFSQHGWNSNERGEIRSDLFFVFDVFSSSTSFWEHRHHHLIWWWWSAREDPLSIIDLFYINSIVIIIILFIQDA